MLSLSRLPLRAHPDLARSKNPIEPLQKTNIKKCEIEADTFAQAFLQNVRES